MFAKMEYGEKTRELVSQQTQSLLQQVFSNSLVTITFRGVLNFATSFRSN
jgi:hypothetical protein